MKKQIRQLQPASGRSKITVAQAARAFRQARGDTPKVEAFDAEELAAITGQSVSGRRVVVKNGRPHAVAAEKAARGGTKRK